MKKSMKKIMKKIIKKSMIKYGRKGINKIIDFLYCISYRFIPVDEDMYIYVSHLGRGYNCNSKYMFEYLVEKEPEKKHIWVLKNQKEEIKGAKVVKYRSLKYFYYMSKSKYWIINCKMPYYIRKKKKQIYIQLWHGTPLKRLGHDIKGKEDMTFYRTKQTREEMQNSYSQDSMKYTYFISPNSFSTNCFESAFNIDRNKIIEVGYPRIDYLINNQNDKDKIKEKLGINSDKKVILYAPTWRDNQYTSKGYIFDIKVDFNRWKSVLGDDYIVIFKPHYLIKSKFSNKGIEDFLYIYKEDVDINDLYIVSDLMITDYSSTFFDYSNLNKPMIFYMYDLIEYRDELRGFYLDITKDLPGPIIEDEEVLLKTLVNIDNVKKEYKDKINEFNKVYNSHSDGKSCERIYQIVNNNDNDINSERIVYYDEKEKSDNIWNF